MYRRDHQNVSAEEMDKIFNLLVHHSAYSYQEDIRKCLDAGMNIHLSKPIEIKKPLQQYF